MSAEADFKDAPDVVFAWGRAAARGDLDEASLEARAVAIHAEIARLVAACATERLRAHLDAVLVAPDAADILRALEALGVVAVLLPEVQALIGFHETCRLHHKDLWAHTLAVVARTPSDADLRWAALLHDGGKIATRAVAGGKVTFVRHEGLGAWLARGVAARFGMPPERAERIAFVVEHHGRVNAYEPAWSDRAVRRLIRDAGPRLDDLLSFSSADFTTRRTDRAQRIRANLADLRRRVAEARASEQAWRPPSGLGRRVAEALEIPPGPEIGRALEAVTAAVDAGELPAAASAEDCLAFARAWLADRARGG